MTGNQAPSTQPMPTLPLRRVLVVKLADIGDVLTATPALRALRHSFPSARIDILVTPNSAGVLRGSTLADRILVFDKFKFDRPLDALRPSRLIEAARLAWFLHQARYDAVITLHHLTLRFGRLKYAALALLSGAPIRVGLDNGRGWFLTRRAIDAGFGARHEVEYWLDVVAAVGACTDDLRLDMPTDQEAERHTEDLVRSWAERAGVKAFVAIHPGSGGYSQARRWPAERFAHLVKALYARQGLGIVLVGTAGDDVDSVLTHLAERYGECAARHERLLNLAGRTSLAQLSALLRRAVAFVGADSGVMHIAAAVGTPVVAIFGPSNAAAWRPWTAGNSPAIVLEAHQPCQPCSYVSHRVGQREGCPERWCMVAIQPSMVLDALEPLLEKTWGRLDT